jgi:hypothetical protein
MRIHYAVDAHSLTFSQDADGAYSDDLVFAAVVYRDDGTAAGSIATTEHVQVSADSAEDARIKRITFDQTIAVPIAGNPVPGNFFLHVGVDEVASGRIGTVEIPTEGIKLPTTQTAGNKAAADRVRSDATPQ